MAITKTPTVKSTVSKITTGISNIGNAVSKAVTPIKTVATSTLPLQLRLHL